MCRAVKCGTCGKTTWAGCGAHVAQVMAGVPEDRRCRCDEQQSTATEPKGNDATSSRGGGFLDFLFGKR